MKVAIVRTVRAGWQPRAGDFERWAAAALGRRARGRELTVLLAGRARSRALNARFPGHDRPTNVLSFPVPPGGGAGPRLLGELVLCPPVLRAEARAQRKSARAHWAHMVVHGVLHLAGYDHERGADSQRMERREIRTLRRLGLPDPYRSPVPSRRRVRAPER